MTDMLGMWWQLLSYISGVQQQSLCQTDGVLWYYYTMVIMMVVGLVVLAYWDVGNQSEATLVLLAVVILCPNKTAEADIYNYKLNTFDIVVGLINSYNL